MCPHDCKKNPKQKRVLFIATFHTPFINQDIQVLKEFNFVTPVITHGFKAIFRILFYTPFHDVVYCWFASVYSGLAVFLANLFRKKSIVVIGGADVSAEQEIEYGIWLTKWKRWFVRTAIQKASVVLAVDPSIKEKAKTLIQYSGENIKYLPTGYDADFWQIKDHKEPVVLTVAHCVTQPSFLVKGIDVLIETAAKLSEISFVVIGVEHTLLNDITIPANMIFMPFMPQSELLIHYQRAGVYCQPSRSEGLPNALCESMLCGCIPIGSDVGGIPLAIGNIGIIVPPCDVHALVNAIGKVLQMHPEKGNLVRQQIIQQFPLKRRINGLKQTVLDSI